MSTYPEITEEIDQSPKQQRKGSKAREGQYSTFGLRKAKLDQSPPADKSSNRITKVEKELGQLRARFDKLIEYLFSKGEPTEG